MKDFYKIFNDLLFICRSISIDIKAVQNGECKSAALLCRLLEAVIRKPLVLFRSRLLIALNVMINHSPVEKFY